METISNQVLPTQPTSHVSINKALFSKIIIAITFISLVVIYFYYQSNTKTSDAVIKNTIAPVIEIKKEIPEITETNTQIINLKTPKSILTQTISNVFKGIKETQILQENNIPPSQYSNNLNYIPEERHAKSEDSNYVFPKLTEKEIKATLKQKDKMANWLMKKSKDKWALIKTKDDRNLYGNNNDSIQEFYVQTTEVTNLEYRTFLFDLLINDRKSDF